MKKITLILSVMLIWGCSQATDQVDNKAAAVAPAQVADAKKSTPQYQPGLHYQVINPAWDTGKTEQVVVYEFFSYMCGHCATFEPYMKKLESSLPEHAELVRVPVVFYPQWKPVAQAYYTFEAMGIVDQAHGAMFDAIHQHRKQFRTIEEVAEWAAGSFDVEKDKFLSTANSFMIDGQIRKGMQMMQAMGVSSTPTLITNGKYMPNSKSFKTRNDVIEVTEYLVSVEAENMGLAK